MTLDAAVHFVLDLGPAVMMPVFVTLLGLFFRQGIARSLRAGLTVGVGFIAVGLVVGLLVGVVGPKAMAFADVLGLRLDVLDVGWPMGATVSFAAPIAAALIPAIFALNIVLLVTRATRTVDVDLWNYWHFIYTGAIVHAATGSFVRGVVAALVTAVVVFKLADWTAPAVEHHFGLPGISLPHTETVNWAPLMYALERVERRIPGLSGLAADPAAIRRRFGLLGEPILMGAILGAILAALGSAPLLRQGAYAHAVKDVLTLAVTMSAVLVVLPKVVAILMEGLIPISEGAREYLQKRFPGRDVLIGLDAAVVIGNPANMAIGLLSVPLMLLLAVVLPGNRMLPFGDLAALPFYVLWGVAASRGNLVRGLLNAVVILVFILWIGTSLAPMTTELARHIPGFDATQLAPAAAGYTQWSGIALGSHVVPWIVIQLMNPGSPTFLLGLAAAGVYGAVWFWVRDDIRRQFSAEIEAAEKAKAAGVVIATALVVLSDALHARPANLLVRMASTFVATVTVVRGECAAQATHILDVLALGARCGDTVELRAEGPDAREAIAQLRDLVEKRFTGDLVPERGEGGAAGVAIGRALVVTPPEEREALVRPVAVEHADLERAARRVGGDLAGLIQGLARDEAALFEPSIPILREVVLRAKARVSAGETAETAVRAATLEAPTDLIVDVRARLLFELAGGGIFGLLGDAGGDDRILVTGALVPSLVALAPRSVSGIVASRPEGATGRAAFATSHAAILARGRGLPLAFVPEHVTESITEGEWLLIDATESEARVWVEPSESLMRTARARKEREDVAARLEIEAAKEPLTHLGVAVRVNIGATTEEIPAGAEGVGLVRTELLHAAWSVAPGESDVALAISTIARSARGGPVVVRLYDAGGDKPLAWLPSPDHDANARGIALLFHHRGVLEMQLGALARVRREHDVRVLVPLTRGAADVEAVRALGEPGLPVGAMIETREAAALAGDIARVADFVCIGTNDLLASLGREAPKGRGLLSLVVAIVEASRAAGRTVTVCGELAGDPEGARLLVGLGVEALSVSPPKLASVKAALRATTREACEREARRVLELPV